MAYKFATNWHWKYYSNSFEVSELSLFGDSTFKVLYFTLKEPYFASYIGKKWGFFKDTVHDCFWESFVEADKSLEQKKKKIPIPFLK